MSTPERCLKCEFWKGSCTRLFKAKIKILSAGGEIMLETQPGLIPHQYEKELEQYLGEVIGILLADKIDSWPRWKDIKRLEKLQGCPAYSEARDRKDFTKIVPLR